MLKRTEYTDNTEVIHAKKVKGDHKDIINCAVKDESGLNDFQKLPNTHGVAIPRVGIERFRIPLNYKHIDGVVMNHDTEASMFVSLGADKTGVNMSRFCQVLQDEADKSPVDNDFFKRVLGRFRSDLRDYDTEKLIPSAELNLSFKYATKQTSLKSENWGWQYYNVELKGIENNLGEIMMSLTVNYEYSSTCPCSLSMAKQYEEDFRSGKTTEGNGIATAHSQRSNAKTQIFYKVDNAPSIEELIALLREALPTETQSLVKRVDEQAFAILNGENPIFVEHVARRLSGALDAEKRILDWNVQIEHWESLHSHNAVAYIQKVRPNLS
ncbi:MAG: GTP cyclohydrolase FolE2 [Bacteriovoracaceae bacterium]|nr:GTP cyclohydrolase FolE2 [Bacteriovoracaceae bacterium]